MAQPTAGDRIPLTLQLPADVARRLMAAAETQKRPPPTWPPNCSTGTCPDCPATGRKGQHSLCVTRSTAWTPTGTTTRSSTTWLFAQRHVWRPISSRPPAASIAHGRRGGSWNGVRHGTTGDGIGARAATA